MLVVKPVPAHEVVFSLFHVRVVEAPAMTVVGEAVKVAVGVGITVTVLVEDTVPPAPVQLRV